MINFAPVNSKSYKMRSKTANWFECSVRYDRQAEDGETKKVTELYVVDALSFGEAEETITREMSSYVSGEFEVKNITPAVYGEVFFSEDTNDDRWYKTRLNYITIDEKTEKEKRTSVTYLVQAADFSAAVKHVEAFMGTTMITYVIANVSETKIMDVYEHQQQHSGHQKETAE